MEGNPEDSWHLDGISVVVGKTTAGHSVSHFFPWESLFLPRTVSYVSSWLTGLETSEALKMNQRFLR